MNQERKAQSEKRNDRPRRIALAPERELARRIDATAALAGKSAPEFILDKLRIELPHYNFTEGS